MTTAPTAKHGDATSTPCCTDGHSCFPFGIQERPRYYPRQLMTPDELTLEAEYFRDRMRRHNVYLHGWGVVCGALVCTVPAKSTAATNTPTRISASDATYRQQRGDSGATPTDVPATEPWIVRVEPGYILGPYGDEIIIDCTREVPLRGTGVSSCGDVTDALDPWCSEVYVKQKEGPRYIAVRYKECQVRPVRAQPAACGCDEQPCEYSRLRDGYEIGILDCCPDSHTGPLHRMDDRHNPTCPCCPDSPWVVLAKVEVDREGIVQVIDNCECRRIVHSDREIWTHCTGSDCDEGVDQVRPYDEVPAYRETTGIYTGPEAARSAEEAELRPAPAKRVAKRARRSETPTPEPAKRVQKRARKATKRTPRKRSGGNG